MSQPTPLTSSERIAFASVTTDDFDELVTLRIAAMRESLERVGRFDPARARDRLKNSFYPEHTKFLLLDGQKIGFYTFRPIDADGFHLDHLYVHPTYQSQGIGSYALLTLLRHSDSLCAAVHVGALKESASNRFYQRHGFLKTKEDEWDIYYTRPASGSARP